LLPKWPAGARYVYRLDLDQRSTNQSPNAKQVMIEQMAMGVSYSLEVRKETPGGGRELAVHFLAYELDIKVGDKVVLRFDSAQSTNQTAPDPTLACFRKLTGSEVSLELDSAGQVPKVSNLVQWAHSITASADGAAETMLTQQFNDGFFQQLAEFGRGLPKNPVEAGTSWPYHLETPAGSLGKIVADSTLTLRRWEDHDDGHRLAVIESSGTLKSVSGAQGAGSMTMEDGTLHGNMWFDTALGAPVESIVDQWMRLKGETPTAPALNRPAVSFTSEIGQKVTVKLVELSPAGK
jgi:hypothetical protein